MKNAAWFALVQLEIVPVPTRMITAVESTVVLMLLVMAVSVNVMLVSKLFSPVTSVITALLTLVEKSLRLPRPLRQLLLPRQLPRRQLHLPLQHNVFQTVTWTALVSHVWLFVTHLTVAVLEVVDSLLDLT